MPFLLFLILLGSSSVAAEAGFFRHPPCQAFLQHIGARGGLELRYPTQLPAGPERTEYLARQLRLEWLQTEWIQVRERHRNGLQALVNFGRALAWEVEPPDQLWRQAIRDMTYQRFSLFLPDDSFMEFAARVPDFIGLRRPPRVEKFRDIRTISQGILDLTEYRYFVSHRLAQLPLTSDIASMAPEKLQDSLLEALGHWNEREIGPPEGGATTKTRVFTLSSAYEVQLLASKLLADEKLPPELRLEIEKHVDFLRKYSFPPDSIYLEFLEAVESYLQPSTR